MTKKEIDESTMEGILTYDSSQCQTVEDHLLMQVACVKKACVLMDKVLDGYKDDMKTIIENANNFSSVMGFNMGSLTEAVNHILERIRKLEEIIKPKETQ